LFGTAYPPPHLLMSATPVAMLL